MLGHVGLVRVWGDLSALVVEVKAVVVSGDDTSWVKVAIEFLFTSPTTFAEDEPDYKGDDAQTAYTCNKCPM